MLAALQGTGHWPLVDEGYYLALYRNLFSEELTAGSNAFKMLKKTVDMAKRQYKKDHPQFEQEHKSALQAERLDGYFAGADRGTLLNMYVALKHSHMALDAKNVMMEGELFRLKMQNEGLQME